MENDDRLRKIAQVVAEHNYKIGVNTDEYPHDGVEDFVILNDTIEVPVSARFVDDASEDNPLLVECEMAGVTSMNVIIEAFAIGSPPNRDVRWSFSEGPEGEIFIHQIERNDTTHDPIYIKLAKTGGKHYTWRDLKAANEQREDKLIVLDEPYQLQFEFTAKFIDYRDGVPWALGEEGEIPIPSELADEDWEELGEVFGE